MFSNIIPQQRKEESASFRNPFLRIEQCHSKMRKEKKVAKLCKEYPIIEVLGHRDTSPDLDGSGEVESREYIKACPCFDVRSEFSNFLRNTVIRP